MEFPRKLHLALREGSFEFALKGRLFLIGCHPLVICQTTMTDYAVLLSGIKSAHEQSLAKCEMLANGCWVSTLAAPKPGKPSQVRFRGIKYYTHFIACMYRMQRVPAEGEEASHLCNNAVCMNPEHLWFESGDINKSRIYCRLFRHHENFKCLHEPRCLGCS